MVEKFSGTGFTATALNIDFLRDDQGNPLKTPNSFLVLHNPVRQKCNDIIDEINNILAGSISFSKLSVDNINIDGNEITTLSGNLNLNASENILSLKNFICDASINENFLVARMAAGIADQGGLIIDQNSYYRTRITTQGSGSSSGQTYIKYEKSSDKTPGNASLFFDGFSNAYINSHKIWNEANDGPDSGLNADLLDGQHASSFANKNTTTTSASNLTTGKWYRIAKNGPVQPGQSGGNRATAKFTLLSEAAGLYHQAITFYASIEFGSYPSLTLINNSNYAGFFSISKIRMVHHGTYEGAAIEVYIQNLNGGTFTCQITDNIHNSGWTPVNFEEGELPAGFYTTEIDLSTNNPLMSISSSTKNIFELSHDGNLTVNGPDLNLGNGIYGTLRLKGGSSGISSVLLYNESTISALFRHTPSAGYMEIMNYIPSSKPYLRIYDSGIIDIGTFDSNDIRLIPGGDVNIYQNSLKMAGIETINSLREASLTKLTIDNITIDNVTYQGTSGKNLHYKVAEAGHVHVFGASDRKGSIALLPYTDTEAWVYGIDNTYIANRLNIRLGYGLGKGIFFNQATYKAGINNDSPSETLDVSGYINASDGLKIATTEVLDSNRKATLNGIINTGTRRSGKIANDYFFEDIAHYSSNTSSITGAFVIQTSIPFAQADMIRIKIDGYNYIDTNCIIDLLVAGYAYTNNLLIRHGYINNSIKRYSVRSAKQISTGNLAIIIGETTDVFRYPKLKVSSLLLGYNSDPARAENWTISILSDLSGYENFYSITEASGYVLKDGDASINGNLNISNGKVYKINNQQVLTAPQSGVQAMTNVSTPSNWDADTVTTAELADIVGTLINKLRTHGLITT